MTLDFFEQLEKQFRRMPDHTVFRYLASDGRREAFTYRRVVQEAGKISLFLQCEGIRPGDAVGILMENHPRWGIAFLAAQSAGARTVPLDVEQECQTLARLIEHAECKFLVSSARLAPKLTEIQKLLPRSLPALLTGPIVEDYANWDKILEGMNETPSLPLQPADLDEPSVIIYTSGTTGNPKGVVLTRRSIVKNVVEMVRMFPATSEDHVLCVLPLYHIFALVMNLIIPLYNAGCVTYLDSVDGRRIARTFQDENITIFVCVPQFYYLIQNRIFQELERKSLLSRFFFWRLLDVSRFCIDHFGFNPGTAFFSTIRKRFGGKVRLFGVGGARFDPEVAKFFRNLGSTVVQAYGLTETAGLATVTPLDRKAVGSVGRPLPHVEVHIDRSDDASVGEILIRGQNLMKEYWKNPEATAQALKGGWFHSGDLGYLDSRGYLHVTGRKKEVIVLASGKNIVPEELEYFYERNCPAIREICIVAVPDETSPGIPEKLHAVLVPDFEYLRTRQIANVQSTIHWMMQTLSQRLPPYQRPRNFEIRSEPLPRTTTRKIRRLEVAKQVQRRSLVTLQSRFEEPSQPPTLMEEAVFQLLRETKGTPVVHPDMNLELDLGFDSLERVEFLSVVQEVFHVEISDERAAQILTVKDLVQSVQERVSEEDVKAAAVQVSWKEILREPLKSEEQREVERILTPKWSKELPFFTGAKAMYLLARVLFRLRVKGLGFLPREYPYLICPNHLSFLDPAVVVAPLPHSVIKRLFFLGYSDYFARPFMSFVGRRLKVVPVDENRYLRRALRLSAEGLRRNLILCVFPEGGRSVDGGLQSFRKGQAILAKEMGVPIVPTAIVGTYEAWAIGTNRIRLHPITVRFGPPLYAASGESYDALNQRLYQAVAQMIREEQKTGESRDSPEKSKN